MSEKLFLPSGATAATGFSLLLVVILTRETSPFAVIVNGPLKRSSVLRRVVRIDVDVLDGQIGGPEGTRARPLVKLDASALMWMYSTVRSVVQKVHVPDPW